VKSSSEVRWFYHHKVTVLVKSWFCGSRLCKEEEARTDQYLVMKGSNEVGVKIRGGQGFEIKARTKMPQPFSLATGASVGRQDAWVKWSLDNPEAVGRLLAIEGNSSEWVTVTKKRWLRQFHVGPAGEIEETDANAEMEHGCNAELCELDICGSQWWSLAFESFGEVNRATNLEQVTRHFLKVLPSGLALTERDSMAYPEWLGRLAV